MGPQIIVGHICKKKMHLHEPDFQFDEDESKHLNCKLNWARKDGWMLKVIAVLPLIGVDWELKNLSTIKT